MAIPTNPFSEFLTTSNYQRDSDVPQLGVDPTTAFSVGLVSGKSTSSSSAPKGFTATGLYGLLTLANKTGILPLSTITPSSSQNTNTQNVFNQTSFMFNTSVSDLFVFRTPEALVGALNTIHENTNAMIRNTLTKAAPGNQTSPGQVNHGYTILANYLNCENYIGAPAAFGGKNSFEFVTKYFLPNAYTGNTAGELPNLDPEAVSLDPCVNLSNQDIKGNGITGAFFTYDSPDGAVRLSKTGIDFYLALNALSYGSPVIISDSYSSITDFVGYYQNLIIPGAIITLDMASYLEGRGITSGTNAAVYGCLVDGYSSGNTYNFCHGSSAFSLNNDYSQIVLRNNVVNGVLNSQNSVVDGILLIHSGLSGSATFTQKSSNGQYTDVFRYPGLDGITSSYQYTIDVAGLTAYRLTSSQLEQTFCVIGKKTKTLNLPSFLNTPITVEIPLVADTAGVLARGKRRGEQYLPAGYAQNKTILNVDSITPSIPVSNTTVQNTLKRARINYFASGSEGIYLASDYVGVTGGYFNRNRYGVTKLVVDFKDYVQTYLSTQNIQGVLQNNQSTRSSVRQNLITQLINNLPSNIKNALDVSSNGRRWGDAGVIVCDDTNNSPGSSILTIDITIYPKVLTQGTEVLPIVAGINVTVTVGD